MSRFLRLNKLKRREDRKRPQFPIDETLVKRQIAEAEKLGPNSIRRVLPEKIVAVRNADYLPEPRHSSPLQLATTIDGGCLSETNGCTTADRIVEAAPRMAVQSAVSLQAAPVILPDNADDALPIG